MPKQRLKEVFQEVDIRRQGELSYEEFSSLYHTIIHDHYVSDPRPLEIPNPLIVFHLQIFYQYFRNLSSDGEAVTLQEFYSFITHQGDTTYENMEALSYFMKSCIRDPRRQSDSTVFLIKEVSAVKSMSIVKFY